MAKRTGPVVVLGASVTGMLAAGAAAARSDRVIVVERDGLEGLDPRKGIPQVRHTHNLFARGRAAMEAILPGFTAAVAARGATVIDSGAGIRTTIAGHRLARAATGHEAVLASRPCIDAALLERLRTLPNVEIVERADVLGVVLDGDRVTGVRVLPRATESGERAIEADVVIDAMGRGSRSPAWLEALGFERPSIDALDVDVGYATRTFRRTATDLGGDSGILLSGIAPDRPRGAVAFAVEDERWMVLLFGYGESRPPAALEEFRAFARNLEAPDLTELVRHAQPLDEGATFRFPRAVRRRYDRVDMPEGWLVAGDALVSTNPSWGAGMTSAALQLETLAACLSAGRRGLARRWHRSAIAASNEIWEMTTGNDLAYGSVKGTAPWPARWIGRYVTGLCAAAVHDEALARAMLRVVDRVAHPATLLAPAVAWRLLRARSSLGERRMLPR